MPDDTVPTWNGDPSSFEAFATSCRWYERSLKDSERKLAASRVWQRLQSAAKSVVKHLNPDDFDSSAGLSKLLDVLRASPLQQLPGPDSFSRPERWTGLKRGANETVPALLVREEELFTELEQSLHRARQDRRHHAEMGTSTSGPMRSPSASPSRSPSMLGRQVQFEDEEDETPGEASGADQSPTLVVGPSTGFFEDELRGYRLLKASRLSRTERQHVLTLTKNSTRFIYIRRALRTLFSDDPQEGQGPPLSRGVWWASEDAWDYGNGEESDDSEWFGDEGTTRRRPTANGCTTSSLTTRIHGTTRPAPMTTSRTLPTPRRPRPWSMEHAYTVAQTASKTLTEARQAVAKVRAARGYFDAKGMKGTGQAFQGVSKGPSKSKGEKGKGKSKILGGKAKGLRTSFGPCFMCGSPSHGYAQCPDRWSKGAKKGSGKKGKLGKSSPSSASGKGTYYGYVPQYPNEAFYADYYVDLPDLTDLSTIYVLSLSTDEEAYAIGTAKVIIDTGATESVAGVASMAKLLNSSGVDTRYRVCLADRPKFRFGNGQCQQATSRIDLETLSMGTMSFYLLDGEAENTPPLVGGRDLQSRRTALSYDNLCLVHESRRVPGRWMVNNISLLKGKHILMDLNEQPRRLRTAPENWLHGLADEKGTYWKP